MLTMLLRQVSDIFIRLFTIIENCENSLLDSIYKNPLCFCTNFEYSKTDEANNLIICYLKIRYLYLHVTFLLFALLSHDSPTGKMIFWSGNKKGKVIKQELSLYYLLLDNTSEF